MSKRKEAPDGIVIYRKSWETLSMFSDDEAEAGRLMLAVSKYFLTGEETEFKDRSMRIAFAQFKSDIAQGWKRFNAKCESARRDKNPTLTNKNQNNRIIPDEPDEPDDADDDRIMLDESVMMDIVNSETDRNHMNRMMPHEPDDAESSGKNRMMRNEPDEIDRNHMMQNKPDEMTNDRQKPDEPDDAECEGEKRSQSISQSVKSGSGDDGRTDRPTDGQTFLTPPQIKIAWAKYYGRNMSASDEIGVQALLDSGYSEQQIINNIRDTAEYEPSYPLRYLRKALQEEKPTRSPSAKVSEREREIASKFEEYLKSTII